jgi:hypothetical protein
MWEYGVLKVVLLLRDWFEESGGAIGGLIICGSDV